MTLLSHFHRKVELANLHVSPSMCNKCESIFNSLFVFNLSRKSKIVQQNMNKLVFDIKLVFILD